LVERRPKGYQVVALELAPSGIELSEGQSQRSGDSSIAVEGQAVPVADDHEKQVEPRLITVEGVDESVLDEAPIDPAEAGLPR